MGDAPLSLLTMLGYTSREETLTLEADYNTGVNVLKLQITLVELDLSSVMRRFGSLFILLHSIICKAIIKSHS